MQISKEEIKEFKAIYEREFGEQIDWSEAEQMARDFFNLYETIYKQQLKKLGPVDRS